MKNFMLLVGVLVCMSSCKKETNYIYETVPTTVQSPGSIKNNVKSTVEFISIAYADLFSTNISQSQLTKLNNVYTSFGDKKLIEDHIILNMLNSPGLIIPTVPAINGDTLAFVSKTFKKFYNREPNAFEQYYLKEQIRVNSSMTPTVIYYSMMTSDEYRYY
jgi:hypothetical protein